MDCLEKVSRKGLQVEWTGKAKTVFRSQDCGMEALVGISKAMLNFLGNGEDIDPEEYAEDRKPHDCRCHR